MSSQPRLPVRLLAGALAFVFAAVNHAPAASDPTVGFVESFSTAGDPAEWGGGPFPTNPGTGGVGGVGDGYLFAEIIGTAWRLGVKHNGANYTGNWLAAGADRVKFSLNDVGANQDLEIHFAIGNGDNFWQCNTGFIPPDGSWSEFTVDLNDSANFSRIISFSEFGYRFALSTVDRVLIRHDKPPFSQDPDVILGDFGMDDFKIESTTVGVEPSAPGNGRAVRLAPPFPNPSRGSTTLAFESFDDAPVTVAVVDARGRVVRRATVAGAAGRRSWVWDGLDDSGRATAAGVYRVRAFGPAGGMSRPLVRVD